MSTFRSLIFVILASGAACELTYRLGAISMNDNRVIYPASNQFHIPVGDSLTHIKSITVEPRLDFIRNHDESCIHHVKGHFDNHDEVFWFCSVDGAEKPGKVFVATPDVSGNRKLVDFSKGAPNQSELEFVLPLAKRREAIIVAKGAKAGDFDIYTMADGKLKKPLETGGD